MPVIRKLYEQIEPPRAHAPQDGSPAQVAELRRVRQVVAAMLARIDLELKATKKRTA